MSILLPETGLLFWMSISFGIVLFVLIRYGFPVVVKATEDRRAYIAGSLKAAQEAEEKLALLDRQGYEAMDKAQKKTHALLKEATIQAEAIVEQAHKQAEEVSHKKLVQTQAEAEDLKRRAMEQVMGEIAGLSVKIAEKVVGEQLKGDGQHKLIDRLLQEQLTNRY